MDPAGHIRDSRVRWELVWLALSAAVGIAANLYTGAPIFDFTLAHVVIALIVGALPTALIFGVVECWVFIRGVGRAVRDARSGDIRR